MTDGEQPTPSGPSGSGATDPFQQVPAPPDAFSAPQYATTPPFGAPPGAPGAPAYGVGAPYPGPPPATSAKAIASLALSLVYLCGLGSLAAVVLGHLARGEIRRSGGRIAGTGLATAGLVLGYLGLVVTLVVGTGLVFTAFSDVSRGIVDTGTAPGSTTPPSPDVPAQPVTGVCPDVAALADVLPVGTAFTLGSSTRDARGVVDCLYGQPGVSGGGDLVLVAIQDDLSTLSVDDYFRERKLDPPALDELGAAAGTAERFGIDRYVAPGTSIDYIDTGAARGERSAVVSVPEKFGIPTQELFVTTVAVLDGIRTPSNVV
jgi:hypothetical protein